ncbi:MAG: GH36-type glycosyl hydrolase domain-containing protein, partial [Candidatus Eiseniibacteriota bacterium]
MTTAPGKSVAAASARSLPSERGARAAWLSNGRYRTLISASGGGYSALGDVALTRWRADALTGDDGLIVFVRDCESGAYWTPGRAPADSGGPTPEVRRESGRWIARHDAAGIASTLEIAVLPGLDCELRRLELRNDSERPRRLEVTTFCEVALLPFAADVSHPAFSRLFIETEFAPDPGALLARRRPRGEGESWPVMVHALLSPGELEYESDRVRFIGRGFDATHPRALEEGGALSGTVGPVLDPALCLRRWLNVESGAAVTLTALLGAAADGRQALEMARAFAAPARVLEAFGQAAERERARLHEQELSAGESAELETLAAALLTSAVQVHAVAEGERDVRDPGERITALGLNPDAVRVVADERGSEARAAGTSRLERASRYWRSLGLSIECCILARRSGASAAEPPDGVHVFDAGSLEPQDLETLLRSASVVVEGEGWPSRPPEPEACAPLQPGQAVQGSAESTNPPLAVSLDVARNPPLDVPRNPPLDVPLAASLAEPLADFNGYGGFNAAGDEYVIRMPIDQRRRAHLPPRPWVNVIANQHVGFLCSETGAGCTWSVNSREHRLTPWANDPLLDPHHEAVYLRDDRTGAFWSPFAGPAPAAGDYEMRHGFGYSRCRHTSSELELETELFVPVHDPVRVTHIRIRNLGTRARQLSLFAVQPLVLGDSSWRTARFIETRLDQARGAVLARHRLAGEFAGRVAFASVAVHGAAASVRYGGDRSAFIGQGRSARHPRALALPELEGGFGAGGDPAFCEQVSFELPAGAEVEIVLLLGEGEHVDDAGALLARYRAPGAAEAALAEVRGFWNGLLGTIRIETPVPALDRMVNGWLLYQTVSCRMWGRTALYQSGGAFGFRDQLQDSLALTLARPDWTRAQLLLHAAHQFVEGDVLHWWHPPGDRGLRTRVVDDLLWLPYGTAHYVRVTGDQAVLNEMAPYLKARNLETGEGEAFLKPEAAHQFRDLYEHCCHAIDRSLAVGAHGLPLFGTGDWNDGMNAVGREGRGESVWMGFFLYAVLEAFAPLCRARGDEARARRYQEHQERLRAALDREAWDGEWY